MKGVGNMEMNDMVLFSVDDHVIEPGDVFERHTPRRFSGKESSSKLSASSPLSPVLDFASGFIAIVVFFKYKV